MIKFLPSVCYFPSTVVLVDDNLPFLEGLPVQLNSGKAHYRLFDRPQEALDFLSVKYQFNPFYNHCISRTDDELPEHRIIDFDVRKIHKESLNPSRFAEISVLVIDYAMPGLTGLDICTKLKDKPYKKILLTGEADEFLAVKAFNEGIINKFIRKDAPNFEATINEAIQELQKKYFQDLSSSLVHALVTNTKIHSKFLKDQVFIDFFEPLAEKLKMAEFYLMDAEGSFMFLDVNGAPKWLVVKSAHEMHALAEFAKIEQTDAKLVKALTECSQIPYFHTDEELQTPPEKWHKFMHPAQKLEGKETYYYAVITDPKAHEIGDVLSFRKYCENIEI
jgi:CheY-like chemotaxis protein